MKTKTGQNRISLYINKFIVLIVIISMTICLTCKNEKRTRIDFTNTIKIQSSDTVLNNEMYIGVAAMLSPQNALPAYEEIVEYLGSKLNKKTKMIFTQNYASMNEMVRTKKVLAAFVCSGPYVTAHDKWGMELIAAPSLYNYPYYYSYILVNKKSQIKTFADLEGKKFAFTDPKSNTGTLVPKYELALMNRKPENYFSEFIYTGSHDKSIEAVANNLVDGAAVDHLIWEYINRKDSSVTSKTKVIKKLGPFCIPPFVMPPDVSQSLKDSIKHILLNMHLDPKGKKILDKLYIEEFIEVDDECYQSIREMENWIKNNN